jgi:hypothetical protein
VVRGDDHESSVSGEKFAALPVGVHLGESAGVGGARFSQRVEIE